MKSILAVLSLVALSACTTTTPVTRHFPGVPDSLVKQCAPLKEINSTDKLSEVLLVVTDNYALYHECEIKNELWNKWYREQKEIFDGVK
jgi:hypothetical protein